MLWKVPQDRSDQQRLRFMLLSAVNASYFAFPLVPRGVPTGNSFADWAFNAFVRLSDDEAIQFITVLCL